MKFPIAFLLVAALPMAALAQAADAPAKAASKAAAPKAAKAKSAVASKPKAPVEAAPAKSRLSPAAQKAVEAATPLEEPDPNVKLSEADLAAAKRVHVGDIPCELGARVKVTPLRREGFFLVTTRQFRYVMHPVESRTGAIRLEDPARGAMWLQLGNKSMLMNQRLGQRQADECQSADQLTVAESMKGKPPINILEPAPVVPATPAAAASEPVNPANPPTSTPAPGGPN